MCCDTEPAAASDHFPLFKRENHACCKRRSMFYTDHRRRLLSINNPSFTYRRMRRQQRNLSNATIISDSIHLSSCSMSFINLLLEDKTSLFEMMINFRYLNYASDINSPPHHEDGEFKALIKTLLHLQLSPTIINCYHTLQKVAQGLRD